MAYPSVKPWLNAAAEARLANLILYGSVALVLVFFYVPIFTLIAFSFQEGRFLTLPFEGFSLRWYGELFRNSNAANALWNSTLIALFAMVFATLIGTLAAIVAVRYRFRLRIPFTGLAAAPLAFPQLLLGIVLLLWFSVLGRQFNFNTGLVTAIIGHVVYIAPFAMVIVAVQVFNFDATLEDAARDCGASTWEVYRYVTLPLLWPGIFSAAIFSFLLSWGNFYLTYSLAGSTRTLPTFVFSGIATGSSPLYPAIATVVFIPGILLVILADRMRRKAA
ncbi:spermidine/putrescine transport system permease protein [Dongia mobilis]|uniref:Spermidine/putrescine transport system permease protein n=1 Tax=Dongia mobilis TaxID=578943 RepID=A0A4R6WZD5_9PROT|nr:ABC transporter permease [Dongia mobilis]TDQ86417.1 spermidine/putrescine transport system permease protein [Dongia mobilis]